MEYLASHTPYVNSLASIFQFRDLNECNFIINDAQCYLDATGFKPGNYRGKCILLADRVFIKADTVEIITVEEVPIPYSMPLNQLQCLLPVGVFVKEWLDSVYTEGSDSFKLILK